MCYNIDMETNKGNQMISVELGALRSVDKATQELRERNEKRIAEMKEMLGTRYVLHPANAPKKIKAKRILK